MFVKVQYNTRCTLLLLQDIESDDSDPSEYGKLKILSIMSFVLPFYKNSAFYDRHVSINFVIVCMCYIITEILCTLSLVDRCV